MNGLNDFLSARELGTRDTRRDGIGASVADITNVVPWVLVYGSVRVISKLHLCSNALSTNIASLCEIASQKTGTDGNREELQLHHKTKNITINILYLKK